MPDEKYFLIKASNLQKILDFVVKARTNDSYEEMTPLIDLFHNLDEGVKKEEPKPKVLPKEAKA